MKKDKKIWTILVAEDDPDDRFLLGEAFTENLLSEHLYFVENGEQLIDYLHGKGKYNDPILCPRPDLILLDLNMPKKDGREALKEIKSDLNFCQIPIVVFTTSKAEEDILYCDKLGGNSFISKPVSYEDMLQMVKQLGIYWFETVTLPRVEEPS